ncbi:shikimate 5-dehydrogenase [Kineococcus rubinsiae]|uniref:shikimate 5-dehydrogenase n=1 Tax=Kineococcus rubinsiae TaxID=2609562 RepID=UPI001430D739|nr:shikimate 5-dehydrogenase [Kineococcus rubinsiae]NIZ93117.1 shikimate 5-dehydrogenase [Kineococcus rubinsiae]
MHPGLSKDTQLCISLSGRPSNIGTRFHNHLYAELGLDYVYKAFTTTDLAGAVTGIRALGIRGAGVSMPFKEDVIPLVDALEPSAEAIRSVNTIVNTDGRLVAHNTDYLAVEGLLRTHAVDPASRTVVLGSGGMAKAVVAALRDSGFADLTVVARNAERGPALAEQYGARWSAEVGDLRPQLVVNATPVGMAGGADALPVARAVVEAATTVFEVVAVPEDTPLVRLGRELGLEVVTGTEVVALQAAEQFVLYTGVRPSGEQIARASAATRD